MRIGNNHTAATQEEPNAHECQPYFQQKAELEDQERRKHELEATERRYGLDGDDDIHELSVGADNRATLELRARQELRGAEHAQELGSI